jgi:glycosyltransferase involved in cell wall biosynthesis
MKVLVIGTSPDTQGGITTVINSYKESRLWKKWNCKWIGSNNNKSNFKKIYHFITGWVHFIFSLPFYDLVHIHFTFGISASRKRFFFYPSKLFGKKVIMHLHSPSFTEEEAHKKFNSCRDLLTKADLVVVLSASWKNMMIKYVPQARVSVVYNATPKASHIKRIDSREKRILYMGILNERKGYADLMQAFAKIAHQVPDWMLDFGGNGSLDEARQLAESLNISKNIVIHGWVSGEKKSQLFSNSKIFCLPSHAEGFPMSVLEAFSNGLSVIVTPVGGLKDDLKGQEDVIFITPGNVDEMATKLLTLITDEPLQKRLAQRSVELATTKFSFSTMIDKVDELYTNLLSR